MKCSYCHGNRGGAYKDYCKGFSFNLCSDCCIELGFSPNNLDSQIKCISCGKYFSPRGEWQKRCTDCFLKTRPFFKPKKIEEPIQQTLWK
jgi:hypothetical protein